jgi:TRAP-type C4-dicarboxylate transport system permease small subunit
MDGLAYRLETMHKWLARLGGAILMIAAVITTYDVFCRFFLNSPTDWALETAQYCLIYGTFLGGAYAFKEDLYIRVDVITSLLPEKLQESLRFAGHFITFVLFLIIAWYSAKYTLFCFSKGWTQNTAMQTPMWIPLVVIPFGSMIISLQNLLLMLRHVFRK